MRSSARGRLENIVSPKHPAYSLASGPAFPQPQHNAEADRGSRLQRVGKRTLRIECSRHVALRHQATPSIAVKMSQAQACRSAFCSRLTSEVELPKASHRVLKGPIPIGGDLRTTSLGVGGVNGFDCGQAAKAKYR